jgi:hypothetical protein
MDDGRIAVFWLNLSGKVDQVIYMSPLELDQFLNSAKDVQEKMKKK